MTGLLVEHDLPSRDERKAVRAAVEEAVAPLVGDVALAEPARCIASGGTAGALARVIAARRWSTPPASLNQYEVTASELRELTRELAGIPLAERLPRPRGGRTKGRAPAGRRLDPDGRRGGLRRETARPLRVGTARRGRARRPRSRGPTGPAPDELRRLSVDRLVRGWGEDRSHVELVARIAHRLFDDTAALHGLAASDRELLGHGASCTRSALGSRPPGCTSTAPTSSRTRGSAGSAPTRWR